MTSFRLGVDYGTSHTVAVLSRPDGRSRSLVFDGSPLLPSAVFAERRDQLLAGADAVRAARAEPARAEPNPKRRIGEGEVLLGDTDYPVSTLVAATLRLVANEATRVAGGPPAAVTVTHPGGWGSARREVLAEAAARAGMTEVVLVPEPVAAARYFAEQPDIRVPVGNCVTVYDLGAGTCDASVLRRTETGFEVLAVGGLDDVGGLDLDSVVVKAIGAVVAESEPDTWQRLSAVDGPDLRYRRQLWTEAREAKESLSRRSSAMVHVPIADRARLVSREQFEQGARPLLDATAALVVRVIAESGVPRDQIAGLFLVGGASRTPLVATILHRTTGIKPTVLDQPELVVAEGSVLGNETTARAESDPHTADDHQAVPAKTIREPAPPISVPPPQRSVPSIVATPPSRTKTGKSRSHPPAPIEVKCKYTGWQYLYACFLGTLAFIGGLIWALNDDGSNPETMPATIFVMGVGVLLFAAYAPVAFRPGLRIRVDNAGITARTSMRHILFKWSDIQDVALSHDSLILTVPSTPKSVANSVSKYALTRHISTLWTPESPDILICFLYELTSASQPFLDAIEQHSGRTFFTKKKPRTKRKPE